MTAPTPYPAVTESVPPTAPTAAMPPAAAERYPVVERGGARRGGLRWEGETKPFFLTSEFIAYVLTVVGVLIAAAVVSATVDHPDYFRADEAWFLITILTVGYVVSRGIAKAGSGRSR